MKSPTTPDAGAPEAMRTVDPSLRPLRLRIGLLLLSLAMLLNQLDRFLLSVLAEPIKRDLHLSDTQLGLLNGLAFALFYAVFGLPLARLADRFDRPRLLAACLFVWTIATAISGFVVNFAQLVVVRVAVAIGEAGTQPTGHTLIADYYPPSKRASALAVMAAGGSLGAMLALILGGILGQILGWRATIAVIGLAGVPVAMACWFLLPEPRRVAPVIAPSDAEPASTLLDTFRVLLRSPTFILLTITATLSVLPSYSAHAWGPAFFMRNFGLTVGEVGLWLGLLTGFGTLIGHTLSGFFSDLAARVGPGRVMLVPTISVLLTGPALSAAFLAPSATIGLILYFIPKVLSIMWYAPVCASIQSTTPIKLRAQAVAITFLISNMVALGLGPTAVGIISDLLRPSLGQDSLQLALVSVADLSIFGAIAAFFAGRTMRRAAAVAAAAPAAATAPAPA